MNANAYILFFSLLRSVRCANYSLMLKVFPIIRVVWPLCTLFASKHCSGTEYVVVIAGLW